MKNEWILDVLTDLKKFSALNNLSTLAEHLDDMIMVATAELSSPRPNVHYLVSEIEQARRYAGSARASENA